MPLKLRGSVGVPPHAATRFDHGDVYVPTGRIFVAHTARGTVEVIDGEAAEHVATIQGCPGASGVLCAQEEGVVFAAARGAGKILVIDADSGEVRNETRVGPRPNGLAWDSRRKRVLVADVEDLKARLVDYPQGRVVTDVLLPGRPRWCVYDRIGDRFLVNIREPACIAVLAAECLEERERWPISAFGPHGLELDPENGRVFVACDAGVVCMLDLATGRELGTVKIAGEPDVIWHNSQRARLYVAIGRPGVIDVIDTGGLTRVEQITTEEGAHATAFDRTRRRLYVFLPKSCCATVYEE